MENSVNKNIGAESQAIWGKIVGVEQIRDIPYKMYVDRPRNIDDVFEFHTKWSDRPFIIQGDTVLTFSGLKKALDAKIPVLQNLGVKPADRVLIVGWNDPFWVINFWACVRIGAVPMVANAWWSSKELEAAIALLKPVLILADKKGAEKISKEHQFGAWETDLNYQGEAAVINNTPKASENEAAVIIFTSGTDGEPKSVELAHRSLLATMQMLLHISKQLPHQVTENSGDIILHTGPLFHIGGVGALLRGVVVGNTLVMPAGRFDPADIIDLIEKHKIRRWNAVPTMITRVLEHSDKDKKDLSSLRVMTLGGSPVHSELLEQVRNGLPDVEAKIATGYGLTENCGQATAASGVDTIEKPGTCGRALPCVEVKIVPREGMIDGEVFVRSPSQMLGYVGDVPSPIDSEGWLHTGDLGKLDKEGYLWITGRCKDLIIRGGENIAPAAVEKALIGIPSVIEAAVFGVPHTEFGEEVMAVVQTKDEITEEQLKELLRSSLASFAIPSLWSIRKESLPVNMTGKIDKKALKDEILKNENSSVNLHHS